MSRYFSNALNLLYPDATATVSLQGLMLSDFKGTREFRTRVLKCKDHDLLIDIFMTPRCIPCPDPDDLPCPIRVPPSIQSILIRELEPEEKMPRTGVLSYKNFDVPFSRVADPCESVDFKDFRWIMDLNGEEFHDRQLVLKTPDEGGGKKTILSPLISIDSGTVYTQAVSTEVLFRRDEEGRHNPLGRIGYRTGVDIRSKVLEITIIDDNGKIFYKREWTRNDDFIYLIQVSNTCHLKPNVENPEETAGKSDFDLFYDQLKDPVIDHRRYDLQECIGDANDPNPKLDGYPTICLNGYRSGENQD